MNGNLVSLLVVGHCLMISAAHNACLASSSPGPSSRLDVILQPLYSQLETFQNQLDAVKLLLKTCPTTERHDDPEWQLVFKGVAGTGVSLYDMWTTANWDTSHEVGGNWRDNSIHQAWRNGELEVKRVKLSLYADSVIKAAAELIFNGSRSDIRSWFSKNRLLSSPWQDITSTTPNFFGVAGYPVEDRRFYMSRNHGGCEADYGWLDVTESQVRYDCEWERPSADYPYPIIVYSRTTRAAQWHDIRTTGGTVGRADYLTIHIETE